MPTAALCLLTVLSWPLQATAGATEAFRGVLAASIGKTFTGAMMAALSLDGRLGLDDRLAEWLGEEPWYDRLPNHDTITA